MTTAEEPVDDFICPGCTMKLVHHGQPHCGEGSECRWLICSRCRTVYDTNNGNHFYTGPRRGPIPGAKPA